MVLSNNAWELHDKGNSLPLWQRELSIFQETAMTLLLGHRQKQGQRTRPLRRVVQRDIADRVLERIAACASVQLAVIFKLCYLFLEWLLPRIFRSGY